MKRIVKNLTVSIRPDPIRPDWSPIVSVRVTVDVMQHEVSRYVMFTDDLESNLDRYFDLAKADLKKHLAKVYQDAPVAPVLVEPPPTR